MKRWYRTIRDEKLKDGSVRKVYHLVFETDFDSNVEVIEKFFCSIMDGNVDLKTEPQNDWETEKRNNSLCYKCVKECDRRVLNRYTIECNQYEPKDEPQTHDLHTNTHECVKDTHDKTENSSGKPNKCETCRHHFGKDFDIECEVKAFGNECRYEPKDEPQTMAEDINRRVEMGKKEWNARHIEDEPHTNADQHVQRVESVEPMWTKEKHEAFYTFLWNVINPNEMQDYIEMFETKDEPQTEEWYTYQDEQEYNDRWQTERSE